MEEPSDHEEKPKVDVDDLYKSTEIPKVERPDVTSSTAVLPDLYRIYENPFLRSREPECHACGKGFTLWLDLTDHEEAYKNTPHIFCKPCNMIVKFIDYRAHQMSNYHAVFTQKANASKIFPKESVLPVKRQAPRKRVHKATPSVSTNDNVQSHRVLEPWEKAAGAQNAEDILLRIELDRYIEEETKHGVKRKKLLFEEEEAPPRRLFCERVDAPEPKKEAPPPEVDAVVEKGRNRPDNEQKKKCARPVCEEAEVPSRRLFYKESEEVPFGPLHRFPCPVRECGAGYLVFTQLVAHMSKLHPGLHPLWCHLCPASHANEGPFWVHMEEAHNVSKPDSDPVGYSCGDCGRHYAKEGSYYVHRMKWEGRPHFYCCELEIKAEDLEKHKNSKTHTQTEYSEPCEECGKDWEAHERATEHMAKTATQEEPLVCEDCGMSYSNVNRYADHISAYNKRPHFRCEPCNEMVTGTKEEHQRSRRHRLNTSDKVILTRWKCPVAQCESAFQFEHLLIGHMPVHPGEKPFPCRLCPEQFWSKRHLKSHVEGFHDSILLMT